MMRIPGLRSVRSLVKVPLLCCAVLAMLLVIINVQISSIKDKLPLNVRPSCNELLESANPPPKEHDLPLVAARGRPGGESHKVMDSFKLEASHMEKQMLPTAGKLTVISDDPLSDGEVAALTQVLDMRISQAGNDTGVLGKRTCSLLASMNNTRGTCIDTLCPRQLETSTEARIRQLLVPSLRPTEDQRKAISAIAQDVVRKKYIFVTAASSNHYNESQALVYNMRQFIFKKLQPSSYAFYYFDLGLKPVERRRVEKNCNCTVKSMPYERFPAHTRKLMCYAWKPLIIKALLQKCEVLVYMDVSIRFRDMDMETFFSTARLRGAQFLHGGDSIPNHTVESMFIFYGDLPCMYWTFPELLAGFSVFHNEPFMNKVVIDPWVSCALNVSCMCPVDPHAFRNCPHNERRVGQCHRFDLSSLTIQMAKLYGDKFGQLVLQANNPPRIARNDRMDFFTD